MAEVWRFFAHEDDFADIDEVGACERLGRVLSFPTISSMDAQTVDWQAFADLRAYMQQAWPRVFAAGEVELIDHSLLVTLAGTDPAPQAGHAHGSHGRGPRGAGHPDRLDVRSL